MTRLHALPLPSFYSPRGAGRCRPRPGCGARRRPGAEPLLGVARRLGTPRRRGAPPRRRAADLRLHRRLERRRAALRGGTGREARAGAADPHRSRRRRGAAARRGRSRRGGRVRLGRRPHAPLAQPDAERSAVRPTRIAYLLEYVYNGVVRRRGELYRWSTTSPSPTAAASSSASRSTSRWRPNGRWRGRLDRASSAAT